MVLVSSDKLCQHQLLFQVLLNSDFPILPLSVFILCLASESRIVDPPSIIKFCHLQAGLCQACPVPQPRDPGPSIYKRFPSYLKSVFP